MLSWNTFTLVSKFQRVCFLSIKNSCLQRKDWQHKFNSVNFDKQHFLLVKQKQKNSKRPTQTWMKTWLKNNDDKSACVNILSGLLLTDKLRHYLQMNAPSNYWSYNDIYTLVTYTSYITYTCNYTACIDFFIISSFLQFTTVHVFYF